MTETVKNQIESLEEISGSILINLTSGIEPLDEKITIRILSVSKALLEVYCASEVFRVKAECAKALDDGAQQLSQN